MLHVPGLPSKSASPADSLKPAFPADSPQAPKGTKFPSSILLEDIVKTNVSFDGAKYQEYRALYKAGAAFEDMKDTFLIKRAIEEGGSGNTNVGGERQYAERKKRAWNIPRGSGLIDWMASEGTKDPVKFTVDGQTKEGDPTQPDEMGNPKPAAKPNERAEYYFNLADDADGLGRDATSVATSLFREAEMFGRAYLYAYYPRETGSKSDPESLEAKMRVIPTDAVDDWLYKSNGELEWIRVHSVEMVREPGAWWKQPEYEKHTWTYIDGEMTACYTAVKKAGTEWKKDDSATLEDESKHDFGRIPVFPVEIEDGINVMDRIYSVLKALFNREASITWALDQQAFAMMVFKLGTTTIDKVFSSEAVAVVLSSGANEDMDFKTPNPQIFDPLFKDCDRLKMALYEVLQATAITAASQTQNARQSASAKTLDMDLIQSLLRAYVVPVRNAMKSWLKAVQKVRGDEKMDVELVGLQAMNTTLQQLQDLINGQKGESPQQKALKADKKDDAAKPQEEPE